VQQLIAWKDSSLVTCQVGYGTLIICSLLGIVCFVNLLHHSFLLNFSGLLVPDSSFTWQKVNVFRAEFLRYVIHRLLRKIERHAWHRDNSIEHMNDVTVCRAR